jgi:hypothetical protein
MSTQKPPPEPDFFASELGVQIAWFSSILGVILGIIPLVLYVKERNKSKLLNAVLEQFSIKESLEREATEATSSKANTDKALSQSKDELSKLTREIENSIPLQARAAFFNAAIPEIEQQILSLSKQREVMVKALESTGVTPLQSSRLKPILETEINATVMARRRLDELQTVLSIFTGFAAASAMLNFVEPFIFPLSAALGFGIVWSAYRLGHQWALVYPDNRLSKFVHSRFYRLLPVLFGAIFVIALVVFVAIISRRAGWYF